MELVDHRNRPAWINNWSSLFATSMSSFAFPCNAKYVLPVRCNYILAAKSRQIKSKHASQLTALSIQRFQKLEDCKDEYELKQKQHENVNLSDLNVLT
jgi:hypothetical protein